MGHDDKPWFLYHFDNREDPRIDRKKLKIIFHEWYMVY